MTNTTWEQAVQWLRNQPDQVDLVHACFYDDPLQNAAERYYKSTEWQAVRKLVSGKRGTALDIGAGRGISSYALARDGWKVTALEPDASDVVGAGAIRALAQEAKLDIQVEQNWGESLPFPDSTFDVVYGRAVLHHAHDLGELCREAARVLKPGGLLIATREHVISHREDLPAFLDSHPLHKLYGGEHAYLLDEYLQAIQGAGLALTRMLNPYESNINLFPDTKLDMKKNLLGRHHRLAMLMPDFLLARYGEKCTVPGRLYTFVARKYG